jgi:hypothetical protein
LQPRRTATVFGQSGKLLGVVEPGDRARSTVCRARVSLVTAHQAPAATKRAQNGSWFRRGLRLQPGPEPHATGCGGATGGHGGPPAHYGHGGCGHHCQATIGTPHAYLQFVGASHTAWAALYQVTAALRFPPAAARSLCVLQEEILKQLYTSNTMESLPSFMRAPSWQQQLPSSSEKSPPTAHLALAPNAAAWPVPAPAATANGQRQQQQQEGTAAAAQQAAAPAGPTSLSAQLQQGGGMLPLSSVRMDQVFSWYAENAGQGQKAQVRVWLAAGRLHLVASSTATAAARSRLLLQHCACTRGLSCSCHIALPRQQLWQCCEGWC